MQGLPPEGKLLFIYLWTNQHCNQAGLYEITLKTISFDTGLEAADLPSLLKQLEPEVAWNADEKLVWVKDFLKWQTKSQSFLIAAVKCLRNIRCKSLVRAFVEYNRSFNLTTLIENEEMVVPVCYHSGDTVYTPVPNAYPVSGPSGGTGGEGRGEVAARTTSSENKRTFGEASNIKLTPEEYEKLVERLGEQGANWWIDELSLAKASKGYKSKSDYFTILAWERRDKKTRGGADGRASKPGRDYGQRRLPTAEEIRDSIGKPLH